MFVYFIFFRILKVNYEMFSLLFFVLLKAVLVNVDTPSVQFSDHTHVQTFTYNCTNLRIQTFKSPDEHTINFFFPPELKDIYPYFHPIQNNSQKPQH